MCISAVISFNHLTEQVSVIDARIEKNLIRRVQDKISNSNQITVLFSRWKTHKRNDKEIGGNNKKRAKRAALSPSTGF